MIYDFVIQNTTYVNLFTRETYRAHIAITGDRVAHVTQPGEPAPEGRKLYDAMGKYALPGLIDTHVHIESSLAEPRQFAAAVVPHGTTTVLADPHEIANVMGLEGVRYMLESTKGLPLRVLVLAPSCVPSVPGLETSRAEFDSFAISRMLAEERVAGLGEVMDYCGVVNGAKRMAQILDVSRKSGKLIQGHAPGLSGEALSRYLACGVESDHETHTAREAVEKLRAGMVLECRYASNCHDLNQLAEVIRRFDYPENVTFCTDDTEPRDLLEKGHLDEMVRVAVTLGMDPIETIKIATVNAARFARLHDRGSLRPGNLADILLVENLEDFHVDEVFSGGVLVSRGGKLLPGAILEGGAVEHKNTVILTRPPMREDFLIAEEGERVLLHTICYDEENKFVTKMEACAFDVAGGYARINALPGFATFAVFERHGVNGNRSVAPVRGLGIQKGAVATTVSHDSHNLFVVGKDAEDMRLAAQTLADCGGGVACVENGEVVCLLELPIAGLMSPCGLERLAELTERLRGTLAAFGIPGESPYMTLASFALTVIPEVRLTDRGLVDTINQKPILLRVKTEDDHGKD